MQEKIVRNKITIISFISSLLVIYFHTRNLSVYGIDETTIGIGRLCYLIETNTEGLVGLATPIFFFISGLLFFRTYELNKTIEKYKSRFFSLVIPYVIWCTVYYLYFVLLTYLPITSNLIPEDMIRYLSISSWINSIFEESYYVLWFLKNLILYVLISPIIYLILRNYNKKILSGLVVSGIIVYLLVNYGNSIYLNGLEYYLVGSYIGINHKESLFYSNKKISLISIAYILFMIFTGFRNVNVITGLLFIFSLWFALDVININVELPWWMSITFLSYVLHDLILEVLEKLLYIVFGPNHIYALLDYLFIPILVYIIIALIAYIFDKYLPRIYSVVVGNRKIHTKL